jgi:hypothetical protein
MAQKLQLSKVLQKTLLILMLPINKICPVPNSLVLETKKLLIVDPVELLIAKNLSKAPVPIRVVRIRANQEMVTLLTLLTSLVHPRMGQRIMAKINHQAKVLAQTPTELISKAPLQTNLSKLLQKRSTIKPAVLVLPLAIRVNLVPHSQTRV